MIREKETHGNTAGMNKHNNTREAKLNTHTRDCQNKQEADRDIDEDTWA